MRDWFVLVCRRGGHETKQRGSRHFMTLMLSKSTTVLWRPIANLLVLESLTIAMLKCLRSNHCSVDVAVHCKKMSGLETTIAEREMVWKFFSKPRSIKAWKPYICGAWTIRLDQVWRCKQDLIIIGIDDSSCLLGKVSNLTGIKYSRKQQNTQQTNTKTANNSQRHLEGLSVISSTCLTSD